MPLADDLTLRELQQRHEYWKEKNFPDETWEQMFMGVVEEVGELAHSFLKQEQGIRGTSEEHEANAQDSVGDIIVFLAGLCNRRGWSLQRIVNTVWAEVEGRDWTKNKLDGKVE